MIICLLQILPAHSKCLSWRKISLPPGPNSLEQPGAGDTLCSAAAFPGGMEVWDGNQDTWLP